MIDFLAKFVLPIVTFLAGAFVQSFRTQYSETISQINELIEEIQSARDSATTYWTKSQADTAESLSIEIRSALHLISALAVELQLSNDEEAILDDFISVTTNGGFDTADRLADLPRAFDVRIAAANLISLLRRRRREVNSWTYLFSSIWRGCGNTLARAVEPYGLGQRVGRASRKLKSIVHGKGR